MAVHNKQIYPAKKQPMGEDASATVGYPASGFFAMHITYPDTEYADAVEDWEYGTNTNDQWKQGLTVIVKTPLATVSAPSEATNVIIVDLKQAADNDGHSKTYNLGTEEAARLIAATINSRRVKQIGERNGSRYLRARYVRMSGKPTHTGIAPDAINATTLRVKWDGAFKNGYPSDMPKSGTITLTDANESVALTYTNITPVRFGSKKYLNVSHDQSAFADFTISGSLTSLVGQINSSFPHRLFNNVSGSSGNATISVAGEPAKHTVVISWENNTPVSAGGYWSPANGGPVIHGLGASVPTWYLTAKPMDGGNMGIPATNYDSRGSTAAAHTTGHGYVRFSIEGLNSCNMADMPPPDYTVTSPALSGITKVDSDTTDSGSTGTIKLAELEYGATLNASAGDMFHLSNGYRATATANSTNMVADSRNDLTNITYGTNFKTAGVQGEHDSQTSVNLPRPIFSSKTLNTSRVTGLQISNEYMVFEDIETTDDQGNALVLTGGSPLGVVIKDFTVQNTREDATTGEEMTGPSTTDGKLTPNLQIQLPNPDEIPGEIFVRSSHDRVQAWSNMTWGLGGLSPPDPRSSGILEASGGASQFDTHDRMLIFHCKRLLHPDLTTKQGLTPHTPAGAVPSGSTRLYAAHRITDHAERGSILTQTNNGTATGYPYPHHRIRFARQGHSFVTPMLHRGTPAAMRRQLHRSHGSAYSLLFEAESEHKHHGFGSGKTDSTTLFDLDTIEVKDESGYEANGSFSSDGLVLTENAGFRLPDARASNSNNTPITDLDYLVAPGQEHTDTIGAGHLVRRGAVSRTISTSSGPTRLTLASALTGGSRYNTASEIMTNGMMIGDYTLSAGRPIPPIISKGSSDYFVSGLEEGVAVPRSGTEIATVPPLLCHDPEYLNLAGVVPNGGAGISTANADFALLTKANTGTGCVPDAFLCNWLAEYSHPALLGTSREHFMTFRYRESGMPRAFNYPATRGLFLRNHSSNYSQTTSGNTQGVAVSADPFERLYVFQWLQNYGYNGLNAGGHGNIVGLRSANAVLMGHTTVREPHGTLRQLTIYENERYSRGEGIGDGINPEKTTGIISYDKDNDNEVFTKYVSALDGMVAYDYSRRLPIRAWGFRTASDALDMLAGDPTETQANQDAIYGKGRFDGGIHDSMNKLPNATTHGGSWVFPADYNGVERTLPIGVITSAHTAEATPFSSIIRSSNTKPLASEQPLGMGATLGLDRFGLIEPTALAAGNWEAKIDSNAASTLPLKGIPMNKGSDPFVDLMQYTGSSSFAQSNSESAVSSTQYGVGGGFHHLRGNALHTNASAVDHSNTSNVHYPTTGWGIGTHSNATINSLTPMVMSEISEHRQVQGRTEPRLGYVIQTENERKTNKNIEYAITSTKAASLNSDLILGQHFPVLPSWVSNAKFTTHSMTINPSADPIPTHSISNPYTLPTWSPDSKTNKGGATLTVAPKTHAKDIWAVRGSADLPPWGGTFILRKTYLNRDDEGQFITEVYGTSGKAATSNQRRKTVDYFVRPMRPLKLFGFASDLQQDGWLMGARSSTGTANLEYQPFTRDNRYGVFSADFDKTLGNLLFTTKSEGAFEMTYPDSNEHDVVYHLIPSASMLQFFKSDAVRRNLNGEFNPEIEARYSQTTHPGGGETIYQSETRYSDAGTGVGGDFAKQTTPNGISHAHMDQAMRLFPEFKVLNHVSSTLLMEDASMLPPTGTLFLVGSREVHYTGKTRNKLTGVTNSTGVADLTGKMLRFYSNNASDAATPSALTDLRPLTLPHLIAPTFIDNAITLSKQKTAMWNRYDADNDVVRPTTLSYRGLLEYDPTDFLMISQRPVLIENGKATARIKSPTSSITTLRYDGKALASDYFPPYLFDENGFALRIAGVESDTVSKSFMFRNINADSLTDFGLRTGRVLLGQQGYIGIRTSDAAMMLLNDAGAEIAGFNVTPSNALLSKDREVSSTLDAHPSLRTINDHSGTYTARKTRGLNIMEIMRNLTQIDGKQLVNEKNGALVYSSDTFSNRGAVLGLGSGIRKVDVSKMYDSPNEIVVVGDDLARNERVFVVVKDIEKMKLNANRGANNNLVRTLRQEIPGLKTNNEALRLAKSILSRAENGAPVINIFGALKASSIQPGEIVNIQLPTHGVNGEFIVFEAEHDYNNLSSNFIIAQYEKGIEGLLSDLQAVSGNTMPLDENATNVIDIAEISLSNNIKVVAVHRVMIRSVSNTGFIIGAKHSQGMGKIGVRDSNKRARPIGTSKSIFYEVK